MRVQAQMEREQRELGKMLATMGPDAAAVDVAGGGKAAGGGGMYLEGYCRCESGQERVAP